MDEKNIENNKLSSNLSSEEKTELERLRALEKQLEAERLSEREKLLALKEESLREREKALELERELKASKTNESISTQALLNLLAKNGGLQSEKTQENVSPDADEDKTNPFSFNINIESKRRRVNRDEPTENEREIESKKQENEKVERRVLRSSRPIPVVEVVENEKPDNIKSNKKDNSLQGKNEGERKEQQLTNESKSIDVAKPKPRGLDTYSDVESVDGVVDNKTNEESNIEQVSSTEINQVLSDNPVDAKACAVKEKKALAEIFDEPIDADSISEEPVIVKNSACSIDDKKGKSFSDLIKEGISINKAETTQKTENRQVQKVVQKKPDSYIPTAIKNKRSATKLSGGKNEVLDNYVKVAQESVQEKPKSKKKEKFSSSIWKVALLSVGLVIAFIGIAFTVFYLIFGKPTDVTFVKYELVLPSLVEQTFKDGDKIDLSGSYLNYTYSDGSVKKFELSNQNLANPNINAGYILNNGYVVVTDWGDINTKSISVNVVHEDIRTSFNLVVSKNVLNNLLLLNGGYVVEPGMVIPSIEVFGQYIGVTTKFKKLSSENYQLLVIVDNKNVASDYWSRIDSTDTEIYEIKNNIMPSYDQLAGKSWWLVARATENGNNIKKPGNSNELIEIAVASNVVEYIEMYGLNHENASSIEYVVQSGKSYLKSSVGGALYEIGENGVIPVIDFIQVPTGYALHDEILNPVEIARLKEYLVSINKVFNNGFGGRFKIRVDLEINKFVLTGKLTSYSNNDDRLEVVNEQYQFVLAKYQDSNGYTRYFVIGALG